MKRMLTLALVLTVGVVHANDGQEQGSSMTGERMLRGAAGAAIGGLGGSLIGAGRGNTAAVAAGAAAGAIMMTGCKPSVGTAVGGLLGALLGSQIGDSRLAKNVGAGVGASVGAVLGSDCSVNDAVRASPVLPRIGDARINGQRAGFGGVYELGRLSLLPPVRTMQDMRDLDRAAKNVNALTWRYMAAGDYESAMISNQYAAWLVEYQLALALSNRALVDSLAANNNGRVTVAPNSYAILPTFARGGDAPLYVAMLEFDLGIGEDEATPRSVIVAGDSPEILRGALLALNEMPRQGSRGQTASFAAPREFATLPIGTQVTFPNGLVMERTNDSIVVHNPKSAPIDTMLSEVGYVPPTPEPSSLRKAAGPIMSNLMHASEEVFLSSRRGASSWPGSPNVILLDNQPVAAVDAKGKLTRDKAMAAQAQKEYQKQASAFRLAVDTTVGVSQSQQKVDFQGVCFRQEGQQQTRSFGINFLGPYAEVAQYWCSSGKSLAKDIYVRHFYLDEQGMIQTLDSLMKDQATVNELKKYDQETEALSNAAQLIPTVGTLESLMKCYHGDNTSMNAMRHVAESLVPELGNRYRPLHAARDFVAENYQHQAGGGSGVASRALDCASALPMGAYAVQGMTKLGIIPAHLAAASDKARVALTAFETSLLGKKPVAELAQGTDALGTLSQAGAIAMKSLYDIAQRGKTFAEVADSTHKMMNQPQPKRLSGAF